MRVAYLVNQYPSVSHSFIRREIRAAEKMGVEVVRLALRGWKQPLPDIEDQAEREQVKYVLRNGFTMLFLSVVAQAITNPSRTIQALGRAYNFSGRGNRSLLIHLVYFAEACLVAKWVKRFRIQHIHAHFGTNSAEVAMLTSIMSGRTWSFTVHGPEEFDNSRAIRLQEKILSSSFVAAVSSFGRAQLYRMVSHRSWSKVCVVRCGLDDQYFLGDGAGGSGFQDEAAMLPAIVCVGRLCEQKGQLLLLDAVRLLREAGLEINLVLAGDGDKRPELEDFISRWNLADNVRITGWLSGEDVQREIARSRALVLPSFAEGLPVVIMEAMALGKPVISTFIAGIPELVQPGVNGWLVPAGCVQSLSSAIRECLTTSDSRLMEMGEAARESCRRRHRVDVEVQELVGRFRTVITGAASEASGWSHDRVPRPAQG